MFGAVAGLLGFGAAEARRMYLYLHLRDTISAATRLNLVGPMEAAKLQRKLGLVAEELATHYEKSYTASNRIALSCPGGGTLHKHKEDAGAAIQAAMGAPLLELLQASHDCMYSRLFSS